MTPRGGASASAPARDPARDLSLVGALVAMVVASVPPLSGAARHTEYAAALQFSLYALAVPALVVVGAPWRRHRGGHPEPLATDPPGHRLGRVVDGRRRHPELRRALAFVFADLAVMVVWRAPAAVAAVNHHGWLVALEAVSLLVFGVGLWLELVPSPPLAPRSGPLCRAVLSAVAMWVCWMDAYVVGMANNDWYPSFHHVAGHGLSGAADQQVAAVVLWFVAAVVFVPAIFWNAVTWLRSEEDADAALSRLVRAERRGAPAPPAPAPRRGSGPSV